jgi:hypothetical protein
LFPRSRQIRSRQIHVSVPSHLDVHVQVAEPPEGEVLFFLRSLGTNLHVRDAQAESLSSYFRAVRPDCVDTS